MQPNTISPNHAIQQASAAFHRGDRRAARQWAQLAASLAPDNEEPWLILAAISTPQASMGYIRRALTLNPQSDRALRAWRWAQGRLAQEPQPKVQMQIPVTVRPAAARPAPVQSKLAAAPHKATGGWGWALLPMGFVALIFVGMLLLALWPGNVSRALALFQGEATPGMEAPIPSISPTRRASADGPAWSTADIAKPTHTPQPTATSIPTATPTPTALPTDSPATPGSSSGQVPSSGKYIYVSISEQHLYAYQDNKLVYSFVASTGMNNATRTGTFQVLDKIPTAYGSTWDLWMPNWMGIYYSGTLENGIHALPILSNGVQLWGGYLGTPISYGCVVLGVEEAQLLYNWAEVGTTVEIRY